MSENLKQLTLENHKKAERSKFVHRMLKREMTPWQYLFYLVQQYQCYLILEIRASEQGVFDGVEMIKRAPNLRDDIKEMVSTHGFDTSSIKPLKSVEEYVQRIIDISNDKEKLTAHVYVRHMGDLSGGQIIKKYVHGSGKHYQFDGDPEALKDRFREKLNNDMADEANICFEMVRKILEEMEETFKE